jgi:hypothetical protein
MKSKGKTQRKPWVAWRSDEKCVRVQVHEPVLAKAFAKLKGVTLAGYGVVGGYLRLFAATMSVPEVEAWMKHQVAGTGTGRATS